MVCPSYLSRQSRPHSPQPIGCPSAVLSVGSMDRRVHNPMPAPQSCPPKKHASHYPPFRPLPRGASWNASIFLGVQCHYRVIPHTIAGKRTPPVNVEKGKEKWSRKERSFLYWKSYWGCEGCLERPMLECKANTTVQTKSLPDTKKEWKLPSQQMMGPRKQKLQCFSEGKPLPSFPLFRHWERWGIELLGKRPKRKMAFFPSFSRSHLVPMRDGTRRSSFMLHLFYLIGACMEG